MYLELLIVIIPAVIFCILLLYISLKSKKIRHNRVIEDLPEIESIPEKEIKFRGDMICPVLKTSGGNVKLIQGELCKNEQIVKKLSEGW